MIYIQEALLTEMTQEAARWYLAGMIDGEGSVTLLPRRNRQAMQRKVRIASCDLELLEKCGEACAVLGIEYCISLSHRGGGAYASGKPRRPAWALCVSKKAALLRLVDLVPVQHPAKQEKLRALRVEVTRKFRIDRNSKQAWKTRRKRYEPRTHCKWGHDLAFARVRANGLRECRECDRLRAAAKRKAAKAVEIGTPEEQPDIVVEPLRDPIPREDPVPDEIPELVPA